MQNTAAVRRLSELYKTLSQHIYTPSLFSDGGLNACFACFIISLENANDDNANFIHIYKKNKLIAIG